MEDTRKEKISMHIYKKRIKQAIATLLCGMTSFSLFACAWNTPKLPQYEKQDFVFFGFWSPYEQTEESYTLYKEAGLNTMFFVNHSLRPRSSDTLCYLGSNATKKSLELCRKVGLKAIPNYGGWYYELAEGKYFDSTPFSDYNIYGEYKDIIVGMHIADEPSYSGIDYYGNDVFTADYQSVYDVPYMVNLFPNYANASQVGEGGYKAYVQKYVDEIITDFDKNRLMAVDYYPFQAHGFNPTWLTCYNDIAQLAKETNSKKSYYIQTAVDHEFRKEIGAAEIGMQLNVAMAFGADWFGFYCYEVPRNYEGDTYTPMYPYCMLNPDGTPSPLYYAVQSETARVAGYSDAYLSYNWVKTVPVAKAGTSGGGTLRMLGEIDFEGTSIKQAISTEDAIVGCFSSDKGEAFMVVNYGDPKETRIGDIELEFNTESKYAAVYGLDDVAQIVKLEKGKLNVQLPTGEGCFVTLL